MTDLLLLGFATALTRANLAACFFGVFIGTAIGVLPGIGALAAISLLLPVSFPLGPTTGLILLAGVYYGAEYGGSTASILLNLPGTPSNAVTCLDGYPMACDGRAGVALLVTAVASFVGGSFGILVLMALTPLVVSLALAFGPAEYVAMMILCLLTAAIIGNTTPARGLAMVLLGGLLGTVGTDIYDGVDRYTFGLPHLLEGVALAPMAMGLFGVAEIMASIREGQPRPRYRIGLRAMLPTRADMRATLLPMLRGATIGSIFGPLPGTGPTIATFASYGVEKAVSRHPERFGKGAVEGVAAPEAANNAAVQTAFIPTLSLSIPGTPTMAIMIGALMMHGIVPGPRLIDDQPELFWGLVASFWVGNLLLLVLNIPLVGLWVALLNVPYRYLYPAIIALICVGAYSVDRSLFNVATVIAFALIGVFMQRHGFHPAPLLIGFILIPLLEENFRRGMILGRGDPAYFLSTPIAAALFAATGVIVLALLARRMGRRWRSLTRG